MIKTKTIATLVCVIIFLTVSPFSHAQSTISKADYQRAIDFSWTNTMNKKVLNPYITPNWFEDNSGLWYVEHDVLGKHFYKISFENMEKSILFDHGILAQKLSTYLAEEIKPYQLPFWQIKYISAEEIRFELQTKEYTFNPQTNELASIKEEKKERQARNELTSPDGKWIAYTKDFNLYLRSSETGAIKQLSTDGRKLYEYASYYGWGDIMEGEGNERPEKFAVNWSPDGKYIQANICDLRTANKMYLLDWSVDSLYRPKLLSYYRGSPGDTNMVYMIPVIYEVETGRQVKLDLPRSTHINSISFRWSEKSDKVYASYAERGYQKEHLLSIDLKTDQKTELLTEMSETNIDNFKYWLIEKQNQILFASERNGWRQLYALDLDSKEIKSLTNGDFYVNDVEYIDDKKGIIYYTASGVHEEVNPYFEQLYRIDLKKRKTVLLTPEKAHHIVSFSPDKQYFFDNYGHANQPNRSVLRSTKSGKISLEIAEADISRLAAINWQPPQIFEATARDGKTTIYGALWKPTNFDPTKTYPIIDATYTGPHTKRFPTRFDRIFGTNQSLAELGFIVLVVDGLGSSGRSKAFHDYSYKNLGGNLEDHVWAIRQLGERFSWVDTTRVGIFGHSAGGYDAAHALLAYPDFYKVGVASSADHDHRMEKAWWPEMYMGWPVDEAYHEQSNITMAGNLKGKLLITHGGIDENVNPSATFKLAEALVQADKEFDLLIFPSQRHGYGGKTSRYFTKKRWNYFVEHLLGAEPIWDIDWE